MTLTKTSSPVGKGIRLLTPHPTRRLRRLDARAFGARHLAPLAPRPLTLAYTPEVNYWIKA